MKLNPGTELEFEQYQKVNEDDFYSRAVVQYAKRWADLMETEMEAGASLPEIAERTSRQADTDGITGFEHGCAVGALAHFWVHGEELRQWHNHQHSYDGPGTVNPASFTIMM